MEFMKPCLWVGGRAKLFKKKELKSSPKWKWLTILTLSQADTLDVGQHEQAALPRGL